MGGETLKVVFSGAQGRVGRVLVPGIAAADGIDLVGEVEKGDDLVRIARDAHADVVVDFTEPTSAVTNARAILEAGAQGVIRDATKNRRITLPGARKGYGIRGEGLPGLTGEDDVMFRAFLPVGIPQHIRDEVEIEMTKLVDGLRPDWWKG